MGPLEIILGIVILVMAVALVFCVLIQSGKDKRLSGTIAGAAETFFAKGKSKSRDKKLSVATTIIGIAFAILNVVFYIAVA